MNFPTIKPQNAIAAAALLAPLVLVQSVRMLFGGGPDSAAASVPPGVNQPAAPAAAPTVLMPLVTKQQKAAIDHLASQRSRITIYNSPFNHLTPQSAVVQAEPGPTTTPDAVPAAPVSIPPEIRSLTIGAVMVNGNGPFALVGGKVRTVGEAVLPGWTITAIDPDARRVTLASDEGTTVTLTQMR